MTGKASLCLIPGKLPWRLSTIAASPGIGGPSMFRSPGSIPRCGSSLKLYSIPPWCGSMAGWPENMPARVTRLLPSTSRSSSAGAGPIRLRCVWIVPSTITWLGMGACELLRTIDYLQGAGRRRLAEAAATIRNARHVYLTGIGSSWHAALTAAPLFSLGGHPVYMQDASELLPFAAIPSDAVIIVISRTGRSIEIVHLLAKARECGAIVIAVTNSEDGPLAQEAQIPIVIGAEFDHGISVNTYSTLAATAGALASASIGVFDDALTTSLSCAVAAAASSLGGWRQQIAESAWLLPGSVSYFLARGSSLGTCHEARLLWEEGVKSPATAMGTGAFRHGPQEMVTEGARFGIW